MSLSEIIKKGHFTKAFIPEKIIPEEQINLLLDFLHSSASSVNIQPWHFVVANNSGSKGQLADLFTGTNVAANEFKVRNASHVIIFCTKTSMDQAYLDKLLTQEEKDGRFANTQIKESWKSIVREWINMHTNDFKDLNHWMEKQTYMALGMMLIAASTLNIDVSPLEGFDSRKIDAFLGLREKGFTATVILSLGYRDAPNDFLVNLPKSRLPKEEVFTFI